MSTLTALKIARSVTIIAALLAAAAMLAYPGGTYLNPATRGYSFFQNSLSDLGSTVSWNGERNPAAPLLLAASIMFVLGAVTCVVVLVPIYSVSLLARWLVRAACALVLFA